jgi:hypothetical protein
MYTFGYLHVTSALISFNYNECKGKISKFLDI